jgi:hypothetical protein
MWDMLNTIKNMLTITLLWLWLLAFWVLYTMLPVSLGCQFLIAPSVFSIDYWACRSTNAVNVHMCCGEILCLYQGNPGFSSNQSQNSVIVNIFLIVLSISHIFFYPRCVIIRMKWKNNINNTVGTDSRFNWKFVETDAKMDTHLDFEQEIFTWIYV